MIDRVLRWTGAPLIVLITGTACTFAALTYRHVTAPPEIPSSFGQGSGPADSFREAVFIVRNNPLNNPIVIAGVRAVLPPGIELAAADCSAGPCAVKGEPVDALAFRETVIPAKDGQVRFFLRVPSTPAVEAGEEMAELTVLFVERSRTERSFEQSARFLVRAPE